MNWDALAAVAEILAAIGVIVSLVYLAAQIRHGNLQVAEQGRSQRLVALADVAQRFTAFRKIVVEDRELASIWLRGRKDLRDLDEAEGVRFDYLAVEMFWTWAMMFLYRDEGTVDEGVFDLSVSNLRLYAVGPGIEEWWRTSGHQAEYPVEFRDAVSDLLSSAGGEIEPD